MPYSGQQADYRSRFISATIVIAFATVLGASPAHTAATGEFRFEYSAYELANDDAAAALYRRIANNVHNYCADPGILSASRARRESTCRSRMLERTIRKLNSERLNTVYRRRTSNAK